jgi:hypothetical protein
MKESEISVPVLKLTVKHATALQLESNLLAVWKTQCEFKMKAVGGEVPAVWTDDHLRGAVKEVKKVMNEVWRMPWENGMKEGYWRLVGDAFPHYGPSKCVCGVTAECSRSHVFWDCDIAQAVVGAIREGLPPTLAGDPLIMADVWLMRTPRDVHAGIWKVVCLAALDAMHHGSKQGYRLMKLRAEQEAVRTGQQRQIRVMNGRRRMWQRIGINPPAIRNELMDVIDEINMKVQAKNLAVAKFWSNLSDFVALQKVPDGGNDDLLNATHPFIGRVNDMLRVQIN